MKRLFIFFLVLGLSAAGQAYAATVTFNGVQGTQVDEPYNQVDVFRFETVGSGEVGIWVNSDPLDGFDSILTLWQHDGADYTLLDSNDDANGLYSANPKDSGLRLNLDPGSFLVAVSQWANEPNGNLFSLGFNGNGDPFTSGFEFPYTLTVEGASVVPVPAAVWLMGSALLGLLGYRRKIGR